MSAKALKTMKEENPELQKQIGCINGFFQLFDRHRLLTGQRTSGSHSQNQKAQNRPTSGRRSNHTKELNNSMQKPMANNPNAKREKQQFSTESSITSMSSSSRSSSMSSEFNRTLQIEPPSTISQSKFPDFANPGAALKQIDTPSRQSPNLRDIVIVTMHGDAQGLSVKTVAKEERKGHGYKHIDSPRPLPASKSANARVMAANEPFHVPVRFPKTPWDSPRLSYDGRDTQGTFKSTMKQKELPRLSLDSREGSIRGFHESKGPQKGYGNSINQLPESEASQRASNVVAKLMGLEAFPNLSQNCETPQRTSTYANNEKVPLVRSTGEYKQYQSSESPRTCKKEFIMPQTTRTYSIKPKFPLEETPSQLPDVSQGPQSPASKGRESSTKASNPSLSVYGEIEKRVAELEFKKSGKDLRALKQILEAMQRYKDSLDTTRDQTSNPPSNIRNSSGLNESSKMQSPRNSQKEDSISVTDTVEIPNSPQSSKSPIVIMKPAKVTKKTSPSFNEMSVHGKSGLSRFCRGNSPNGRVVDKHTAGFFIPRMKHNDPFSEILCSAEKTNKRRTSKLMQSSKVPQDANGENATSSSSTGTESPRLQQKKSGLERCSQRGCASSNSSSNRRQTNRQSIELSSPRTPRQKFSTLQEGNECFSKTRVHRRDFEHHVDNVSPGFDRDKSLASRSNIELIHIDQSEKTNRTSFELHGLNQNIADKELIEARSTVETKVVTVEKPSPVSVLDAALFRDDPPSPVKKKSHNSKDSDEALNPYEREETFTDLYHFSNTTEANFSNEIIERDINPLQLVQKLHQVDCSYEEPNNCNKPPCDRKDPDRKYISEILLASGLLNSPSSCQTFHSANHLISPKLFLALEQIKTTKKHFNIQGTAKTAKRNNDEQIQRKLIFDVVNDILVQKLILKSSSRQWFQPSQLADGTPRGQWLLDKICSEIDQLQHNNKNGNLVDENEYLTSLLQGDLKHHFTMWTDYYSEVPNVVLDIERLIFKDLITEIVKGEEANHPGRHCRQLLFPQ